MPLAERFWHFVPDTPPDACWQWFGSKDKAGYGRINRGRGGEGIERAHRASWIIHYGPIPAGAKVVQTCGTNECTNPAHLILGTMRTAMLLAVERGTIGSSYGLRNGRAKLSDDEVALIRAMRSRGWKQSHLALAFNVGASTIQGIVSGERRTRSAA